MRKKSHSRYLAMLMALVMIFQFAIVSPQYAFAEVIDTAEHTEETSEGESQEVLEEAGEPA